MSSNILFSLMTNNNTSPLFIFSSRYIQTYTHIHTYTHVHAHTHIHMHTTILLVVAKRSSGLPTGQYAQLFIYSFSPIFFHKNKDYTTHKIKHYKR